MKRILNSLILLTFLYPLTLQAACGVHDQICRFHSIGAQKSHIGKNFAHHTKGTQETPAIPNTPDGLYFFGAWQNNSNGSSADLDIDVLLPDAMLDENRNTVASGPFIISNNAHLGGAPASSDPFSHIPNEHDRHVDTYNYQITFASNTATAIHSQDANGLAPVTDNQTNETCNASNTGFDSCEHVHIKGNIPSGIYGAALTNYDIHNLADPSSPYYNIWAEVQGNINGDLVYFTADPYIGGSIHNKGETSPIFTVGFANRGFDSHAEGVVLDNYQTSHFSYLKYGDIYKHMQGNYLSTYQDTFRDYWKENERETINAKGKVNKKENLGITKGSYKKNVFVGTNTVNRQYIAPPPPPQPVYGPVYEAPLISDKHNAQMYDATSASSKGMFEKFSGEYVAYKDLNDYEKALYSTNGTLKKLEYEFKVHVDNTIFEFSNDPTKATVNTTTGFITGIPDAVNGVIKVVKYTNPTSPIYYLDNGALDATINLVDKVTPAIQGYLKEKTDGYYDPKTASSKNGAFFSPTLPAAKTIKLFNKKELATVNKLLKPEKDKFGNIISREPKSFQDKFTLDAAKRGEGIVKIEKLGDHRYTGMQKIELETISLGGRKSNVHYILDPTTGKMTDFKFKKHSVDYPNNFTRPSN